MPLFTGDEFTPELDDLTVGLSRVLFPIVVLLGLNGLLVGILNAYDHFTIPAIAPLVWNVVIIAWLVGLRRCSRATTRSTRYAIGVLLGTIVQFAMCLPVLQRVGFHLKFSFDWRDPRVKQVLMLMLPVTIGLGLINFNLLINSSLGSLVSERGARRDRRRLPDLHAPPGHVQRRHRDGPVPGAQPARRAPRHRRPARSSGNGMRQIFLLLIPAAAATASSPSRSRGWSTSAATFDAELDRAGRRGAVLVLLQPAVQRA